MKKCLIVCLSLAACSPNLAQRNGSRYPALPSGCPVEYIENTGAVDMSNYENLGQTTISGTDGFSADAKSDLAKLTCDWGGTAVSILASANMSIAPSSTTFSILRKRDNVSVGAKLACEGIFVNGDSATVDIKMDGTATMAFQSNSSTCKAKPLGGSKLLLDCGSGFNQEGVFASDCGSVSFGGMTFTSKK